MIVVEVAAEEGTGGKKTKTLRESRRKAEVYAVKMRDYKNENVKSLTKDLLLRRYNRFSPYDKQLWLLPIIYVAYILHTRKRSSACREYCEHCTYFPSIIDFNQTNEKTKLDRWVLFLHFLISRERLLQYTINARHRFREIRFRLCRPILSVHTYRPKRFRPKSHGRNAHAPDAHSQ